MRVPGNESFSLSTSMERLHRRKINEIAMEIEVSLERFKELLEREYCPDTSNINTSSVLRNYLHIINEIITLHFDRSVAVETAALCRLVDTPIAKGGKSDD
jgi:hypothetical protein